MARFRPPSTTFILLDLAPHQNGQRFFVLRCSFATASGHGPTCGLFLIGPLLLARWQDRHHRPAASARRYPNVCLLPSLFLPGQNPVPTPPLAPPLRSGGGGMGGCVFLVLSYEQLVVRQRFLRTHSRLRLIPCFASSFVRSRKDDLGLDRMMSSARLPCPSASRFMPGASASVGF